MLGAASVAQILLFQQQGFIAQNTWLSAGGEPHGDFTRP